MTLYFGIALDEQALPVPAHATGGRHVLGPQGLLLFLESHLGLAGHPRDDEYLRIEQYRQVLHRHLESGAHPFYAASFAADQFATAANLLQRRDELLLAGWGFALSPELPERLRCLAELEALIQDKAHQLELSAGYAGRYDEAIRRLSGSRLPLSEAFINEPMEVLPVHFRRLFALFREQDIPVVQLEARPSDTDTDLGRLQQALLQPQGKAGRQPLKGDGSLLLLRGKRESGLAAYLAQLLRLNPEFRPAALIPGQNPALGQALIHEGLPSLGLLSASLARPTLQVLKLAPVFLWEPIDPYKIMEFVSLAIKPLERELSNRIAAQMAQTPGLGGDAWRATIARYFDEMRERAARDRSIDLEKINFQYNFWFNRRRYDIASAVPKEDAVEVFAYLARWAYEAFEEEGGKNNSLLVLSEQAKRIRELLEALPEVQLSNLELERIVRTIYEPAPVQLGARECGFMPYTLHPGAIIGPLDKLVWWNFIQNEPEHFFSRWYQPERAYLEAQGLALEGPDTENDRLLWQRKRPVFHTQKQLLLLLPETAGGQDAHPHPLLGDMEAAFGSLASITCDIDRTESPPLLARHFHLPAYTNLARRRLGRAKPFLQVRSADKLGRREEETLTSLETLLYYPYQWVFQHQIRLRKSSILSIVKEKTLMGNLAHRLFEKLLGQDIQNWERLQVEAFIDREAPTLLAREGAVMLLYGKEPERAGFLQRVKFAAWSLTQHIRENQWQVKATEMPLQGRFLDIAVSGRADLVLERGAELAVIDLKWRGARYREESIRNEEDLQLVLYSKLLGEDGAWAHTAYFIMEKGQLLARNKQAFQEINAIAPQSDGAEANQRILARMEATYRWRVEQIRAGKVEVRCEQTRMSLEEAYSGHPLTGLLEMKTGDAPFDDYRTLINLIE
ncbi:MAG: PD-(D/E)XK nuclease family protein [Phaeodactylibacter sp.]|nr:PD-(D/E)XK nuclease family protein [Phaeodactylibacter sp.]MCB9275580.1 PD-(D/E)XK nuclease family protein [Lewinellaceae bacterium]